MAILSAESSRKKVHPANSMRTKRAPWASSEGCATPVAVARSHLQIAYQSLRIRPIQYT